MTDTNPFVIHERPEEISTLKAIGLFIYNHKERKILTRTVTSWAKILFFYAIFYTCLAGLTAVCFKGMFHFIDPNRPTYLMDDSLIGNNPGLGFRPISENVDREGPLIWYRASNPGQVEKWTDLIDIFLKPYRESSEKHQVECSFEHPPPEGKVCKVEVQKWAPCNAENGFTYNRSSPCIFIKLNRIYGWAPEHYDSADLPAEMPESLKEVIRFRTTEKKTPNMVWLHCQGETPSDREHIGPIEYYPTQGFPSYFFPYTNNPGYLSPLVAVRLAKPQVNVLINIECRVWAKNIRYSNHHGVLEGATHFEVLID